MSRPNDKLFRGGWFRGVRLSHAGRVSALCDALNCYMLPTRTVGIHRFCREHVEALTPTEGDIYFSEVQAIQDARAAQEKQRAAIEAKLAWVKTEGTAVKLPPTTAPDPRDGGSVPGRGQVSPVIDRRAYFAGQVIQAIVGAVATAVLDPRRPAYPATADIRLQCEAAWAYADMMAQTEDATDASGTNRVSPFPNPVDPRS